MASNSRSPRGPASTDHSGLAGMREELEQARSQSGSSGNDSNSAAAGGPPQQHTGSSTQLQVHKAPTQRSGAAQRRRERFAAMRKTSKSPHAGSARSTNSAAGGAGSSSKFRHSSAFGSAVFMVCTLIIGVLAVTGSSFYALWAAHDTTDRFQARATASHMATHASITCKTAAASALLGSHRHHHSRTCHCIALD